MSMYILCEHSNLIKPWTDGTTAGIFVIISQSEQCSYLLWMFTCVLILYMYYFTLGPRESQDNEFGSLLSEQRDRLRSLQRRSGERVSGEYQSRSRDLDQSDSDSEEKRNCTFYLHSFWWLRFCWIQSSFSPCMFQ